MKDEPEGEYLDHTFKSENVSKNSAYDVQDLIVGVLAVSVRVIEHGEEHRV